VGALASPGTPVGQTYYDWQHNGSTGRQVDEFNGTIQVTFMDQDSPQISPGRRVKWNRALVNGSPVSFPLDNGGSVNLFPLNTTFTTPDGDAMVEDQAGYTNFRLRPDGKGVAFYHAVGAFNSHTATVDQSPGNGLFTSNPAPQPAGPQYIEDPVIWPHGTVVVHGADTVVHVVGTFSGDGFEFWYWRGTIIADSVAWEPPVFIDSAAFITATIEATASGDTLAIVYTKEFDGGLDDDVVYRMSYNGGDSWEPMVNLTNYTATSDERAYLDLDALFDEDGVLHIIWNTLYYNIDEDAYYRFPSKLNHWNSQRGTIRPVTAGAWENFTPDGCSERGDGGGSNNAIFCKENLIIKPLGEGPGAGIPDELLYAVWVQLGPTSTDCATQDSAGTLGGYVNAELYWSVSSDKGNTWDRPQNITGTETPDCLPGDCASEHWVSAAARADSGVYISYMLDTHPAGAILTTGPQGEWSEGPYMIAALEARTPVEGPVISVGPRLKFQELNVGTTGTETVNIIVSNLGNALLTFDVGIEPDDGGNSHILVNGLGSYSGSILPGAAAETVVIEFEGNGLPDPSEYDWRVKVTSNDELNNPNVGGDPIYVDLNVFVANVWYTCERDTLSTTQHRLSVGSCLELGNAGSGGGLYKYADSSEWLYDASLVIARLDGATKRAYRDVLFNSIADRSRDSNRSFRAQGPINVARTAASDIATGYAYTTDSLIRVDYEVTAFKDPGLQDGGVMKYTITNRTATTFNGLILGAAADLDVDSSSAVNDGFVDDIAQFIGAQGGYIDTVTRLVVLQDNYAAMFYIPLDTLCNNTAAGAQVLDNVDYVYPENSYNTDSLYNIMDRMDGWNGATWQADTISDINMVMVDTQGVTLGPDDTLQTAFGFAVSDVSVADLAGKIARLRFATNSACAICPIEKTGDVNESGTITSADIIYLVGYVFKGGDPPTPCVGSGDVNCSGSVTSADIIYLVGFVFKGGDPPCDFCEMLPSDLCP